MLRARVSCSRNVELGKYQLVAEIARGGMGVVYLATSHGPARFSKLLVVKELKPEFVEDSAFLEMFLEEARLAARLNHANIVQTYEVGTDGRRHFLVMDYLDGMPLSRVLKQGLSLPLHVRVLIETLQGLHHAHTLTDFNGTPLGLVHRDATPQNVFLTFDGQVKLVDFGIAKAKDSNLETQSGVLKGKPSYMPREQIMGEVDARSDVFSVGVMLWEALAGRRMWQKRSDIEILTLILQGQLPSIEEAAPHAPRELVRIVQKATSRDVEDRFESADQMASALDDWLGSQKASSRELARVMNEMFASQRIATREAIEKHLSEMDHGRPAKKLPSLRPTGLEPTPSGPRSSSVQSLLTGTLGAQVPPSIALPPAKGPPAKRVVIVAAVAATTAIFAVAWMRGSKPPLASSGSAVAPAPTAPPSDDLGVDAAPAPAASTYHLHVSVSPPGASLALAGRVITNPAQLTCRAGDSQLLRASAPGRITVERELACDRDSSVELALEAAAGMRHGRAGPAAAAPAAPPPRGGDVNPNGGVKPVRPIETASPYGN